MCMQYTLLYCVYLDKYYLKNAIENDKHIGLWIKKGVDAVMMSFWYFIVREL